MIRVMHDTRPWAGTGVGCMHPDPCNALQRFKESTNRVLDPDYNSRNSSSVGETCSDYCNDSCSYYCSDNDSSSATSISPRISASWVTYSSSSNSISISLLLSLLSIHCFLRYTRFSRLLLSLIELESTMRSTLLSPLSNSISKSVSLLICT